MVSCWAILDVGGDLPKAVNCFRVDRACLPIIFAGLLFYLPAVLAQDAYLDALADEAAHLEDGPSDTAARDLGGMPKGLDMAGFEDAMKKKFFGSYLFYSKLSDEQKQLAYETYRQDNDIETIRKKIMDLFSGN